MKKKRIGFSGTVILLILAAGLAIILYPSVSNLVHVLKSEKTERAYYDLVDTLDDKRRKTIRDDALSYNQSHRKNQILDAFQGKDLPEEETVYDHLLDPAGDGIMGYLSIPKIHIKLAIYHGTSEKVLEEGCGHVEGTSLPVGGTGSHAVLAGHRGLPSARLFTDLDQVERGDIFFLSVLDDRYAYQVDQIKVVLPEETEDLAIDPNMDYVTLLTCTPYGVNTHRLLIRGSRVDYEPAEEEMDQPLWESSRTRMVLILIGASMLLLFAVILILFTGKPRNKKGERRR